MKEFEARNVANSAQHTVHPNKRSLSLLEGAQGSISV